MGGPKKSTPAQKKSTAKRRMYLFGWYRCPACGEISAVFALEVIYGCRHCGHERLINYFPPELVTPPENPRKRRRRRRRTEG